MVWRTVIRLDLFRAVNKSLDELAKRLEWPHLRWAET